MKQRQNRKGPVCLALITLLGCTAVPEKPANPPAPAPSPSGAEAPRLEALKQQARRLPILARLAIAAEANAAALGPGVGAGFAAPGSCQSLDQRLAQRQALEGRDPAEWFRRLGKPGRGQADQAHEVALTSKALGIVRDGAYIGDSVDFITAVTRQLVEYPSQVEANLDRLLSGSPSQQLRNSLAALHGAVKADIAGARRCGYDINRYIKRLIPALPEQRCEHRMGNRLLTELRTLPEAELAAAVARSAVDNPTLATAIQIYAYGQWGLTITDDDLRALSAALDRNPDLNPLVNAGIDALVRSYHLDRVVEGVEKAGSGCGGTPVHE